MSGDPPAEIQPVATPPAGLRARLSGMLRRDAGRLLFTGVPHLFAALALTQGISILRRVLLARILSVGELGQMTYVMQIADFITILADLGICTAVLKYAAEPVSDERKRQIYMTGLLSGTAIASVVGLLYMAAVLMFTFHEERAVQLFMLMVVPYIPLAAIVRTPLVFMQARKEIKRAARFTAITQVLSLVLLVGATWLYGLWGFFVTVSAAPLSNLFLLLFATRRELRWVKPSRGQVGELVSFGWISMIANALGFANMLTTVVLLRHLTGSDEQVGIFGVAMMVMTGMRLIPAALMQVAFPYLSALLQDPQRLRGRMRELRLKQSASVSILVVGWLMVGYYVLSFVFGNRYAEAFWPACILLVGLIPFAWYAPQSYVLIILGRVRSNMLVAGTLLVTNAVVCSLLIPVYGPIGAAMSVALAHLVAVLPSGWLGRRALAAASSVQA